MEADRACEGTPGVWQSIGRVHVTASSGSPVPIEQSFVCMVASYRTGQGDRLDSHRHHAVSPEGLKQRRHLRYPRRPSAFLRFTPLPLLIRTGATQRALRTGANLQTLTAKRETWIRGGQSCFQETGDYSRER
ncbi:unnamed protein product [Rangifer tarandus platyrhynchus]|uniref:Uncharacterized protein n=1 Tax=Rangifer tarandus platyrhynchus TaxID=3082113 RepID=A0AC59ZZ85_RANTA